MKILNLYAGIGGNRKLWGDEHKVTAVEINPKMAKVYQGFFPNDKVIVADAHEFLAKNFKEFDFIWSSPPCPSHSKMQRTFVCSNAIQNKKRKELYPDMKLWQEIIFLREWFKGKFVVENVIPYYKPILEPQIVHRHCFWANFKIPTNKHLPNTLDINSGKRDIGFDLTDKDCGHRKDQVLHNCVEPELGLYILKCAFKDQQKTLQFASQQNKVSEGEE